MLKRAAFFDMDKTLLSIDSGMSWSKFLYRRGELQKRMLAKAVYWSALYKLALLDMESVFARLCLDLEGDLEADMIAKCAIWYRDDVAQAVAPAGKAAITRHRERGDVIVLATGSTQYAAGPVAAGEGIEHVLSSRLQVVAGKFTGKADNYCFGHHKVTLAQQFAAQHQIDLRQSTFYSDSFNDLPMLSAVGTAIAVNPDVRLRRHATAVGWQIERW